MRTSKRMCSLISAASLALAAMPVAAQVIPIPASPLGAGVSDRMSLFIGNINAGNIDAIEGHEPGNVLHFIDTDTAFIPLFGRPTVLLDSNGQISDIFGVAQQLGHTVLGYMSDASTAAGEGPIDLVAASAFFGYNFALPGLPGLQVFVETPGTAYDMTVYLNPANSVGYTRVTFQSDGDVPDGGMTLALLGFGLMGIETVRRRFMA